MPSSDLKGTESAALNDLLLSHNNIFTSSSLGLCHTSVIEHHIDTGNARPKKQAPVMQGLKSKLSLHSQRYQIDRHISKMLNRISLRCHQVLARKKGGFTRFCADFCKLITTVIPCQG